MAVAAPTVKSTIFDDEARMFPILVDGQIPTDGFLEASRTISSFVAGLGVVFSPVTNDLNTNIGKIDVYYQKDKQGRSTLQKLVDSDLEEHGGKMGIATEGLLWLKRGLEFMRYFLEKMVQTFTAKGDDFENLKHIINEAYLHTLHHHHTFIPRKLFRFVAGAAPYRHKILLSAAYGKEDMDAIVIDHLKERLPNFNENVEVLAKFYVDKNLDKVYE